MYAQNPETVICDLFLFIGKQFWLWKGEQIVGFYFLWNRKIRLGSNVQNIDIFLTLIDLEFAAFSRFLLLERSVKIVPTSEIQAFHLPLLTQQP